MPVWERALVVGASSGIGAAVAHALIADGTLVAMVARRREVMEDIAERARGVQRARAYTGDVRHAEESRLLFERIVKDLGGLDLVVYSSGVMPKGSAHGYPTDEDLVAIETNFAGAVVWLNTAAQYFDAQGHGTIVGIGSVAGDRGRRDNPVYNATKAALATYLESLRCRLATRGVKVVTIKPGFVATPMVGPRPTFPPAADPDDAARHILQAAAQGKRVAYVPPFWRWPALLLKALPSAVLERLPL